MYYGTYCRLGVRTFASAREVIRAAHGRLTALGRSRAQREARHAFLREILGYHADAQQMVLRWRL